MVFHIAEGGGNARDRYLFRTDRRPTTWSAGSPALLLQKSMEKGTGKHEDLCLENDTLNLPTLSY